MREIKFRAWDTVKKKMIFGPSDGNVSSSWVYTMATAAGYGERIILMESTGLKDEKEVEIYEGDVLKEWLPGIGPYRVAFENGSFVCYHREGKWGLLSRAFEMNVKDYHVEVIGNIYSNPELLKP